MKQTVLNFSDLYLEGALRGIPITKGIYVVFAAGKKGERWRPGKILEIGQGENLRAEVGEPDKRRGWRKELTAGKRIGIMVAMVEEEQERQRCVRLLRLKWMDDSSEEEPLKEKEGMEILINGGLPRELEKKIVVAGEIKKWRWWHKSEK